MTCGTAAGCCNEDSAWFMVVLAARAKTNSEAKTVQDWGCDKELAMRSDVFCPGVSGEERAGQLHITHRLARRAR